MFFIEFPSLEIHKKKMLLLFLLNPYLIFKQNHGILDTIIIYFNSHRLNKKNIN